MIPARHAAACLAAFLALPAAVRAEPVSVVWKAEAATVVDEPFGLEVPRLTVVEGYLTFDPSTPDEDESDDWGHYPHDGNGHFLAAFLGHEVLGSATPWYEVYDGPSPSDDTFRLVDGPRPVGSEGGVMSFDGDPDETIQLWLSIVDDVQEDDSLEDNFAEYVFGPLGTPHTFSLEDSRGTMLLQLLEARTAVCGDANGGGITAADALLALKAAVGARDCFECLCDADGSGGVKAGDALRILKRAVGTDEELACGACL